MKQSNTDDPEDWERFWWYLEDLSDTLTKQEVYELIEEELEYGGASVTEELERIHLENSSFAMNEMRERAWSHEGAFKSVTSGKPLWYKKKLATAELGWVKEIKEAHTEEGGIRDAKLKTYHRFLLKVESFEPGKAETIRDAGFWRNA